MLMSFEDGDGAGVVGEGNKDFTGGGVWEGLV